MEFLEYSNLELVDTLSESQAEELGTEFIKASEIVDALSGHVEYMLIGAHATGRLTLEPRATRDVDVVVSDPEKAKSLLLAKYPYLKDNGNRLTDAAGNTFVDILNAAHPLYKATFKHAQDVGGIKIASAEGLLVMKFVSSHSPLRELAKKKQDEADFLNVASSNDIDMEKAKEILAEADPEIAHFHGDEFVQWVQSV